MQDITERKLAQEALELSRSQLAAAEEQYRTLVEQMPIAMFTRPMDVTKPNIYVSPQVESMLGYPAEEWVTEVGAPPRSRRCSPKTASACSMRCRRCGRRGGR